MNIDALTGQVETVLERAQAELDREIARARKVVADLNAEKSAAQNAITQLADERKRVQAELDAMTKQLNRASDLSVLDFEIKKSGKQLEALKAETAKASTALAAVKQKCTEAEGLRVATWNEVASLRAQRVEHVTAIDGIRVQLGLRR